ncbi:MAG: DUF4321 domain-containing protein [Candidatus Latescibacterota bacterium]|jgi:hypothetical protein
MLRDKPVSHLILILFTSTIGANIIGEGLRAVLHYVSGPDTVVERALLQYVEWSNAIGPLNLIIVSFSFDLALRFNVVSLLGIFVGWYYFRYSY